MGGVILQGTYYKTLWRNEFSGDTQFLFCPASYCAEAKDGLVLCRGKIAVYHYRLPLAMDGHFEGSVFLVSSARADPAQTERMLEYLFEGSPLTDAEKRKALGCGDLLAFSREHGEAGWYGILGDKQKAHAAVRGCERLNAQQEVSELCARHGILPGEADALIRCGATLHRLRQNAYLLFFAAGIHIYKADSVMSELNPGFTAYHPSRVYGYVLDAMRLNEQCGNPCIAPESLCALVRRRMGRSGLGGNISLAMLGVVLLEKRKVLSSTVYGGNVLLYRAAALGEENTVIRNILRLNRTAERITGHVDVREAEMFSGLRFTEGQTAAFRLLETGGVKILTGPPGSGKTALVQALIRAYRKASGNRPVRLAATTGRAAQVMAETCGEKAETLHRLLDIRPFGDMIHSKDENHPVEAGMVVVDEVSMLGLKLFSMLVKAVKSGSILLLVGDSDQLQSVEYGNVLRDLSGVVETCTLTETMRQSGTIYANAQRVNCGNPVFEEDGSFHIYECADEIQARSKLWENAVPGKDMLLTTVTRGTLGTHELNREAQKRCGRGGAHLSYGDDCYYAGDAVIMTKTCYEKGYYNGDIGIIKTVGDGLDVQFAGRRILLGKTDYPHLALAYCVTIHKSQGSEFGRVHVILPPEPDIMLTRRLLYTAMTRAKREVSIYSINGSMARAVSNASERPRISVLGGRLMLEASCQDKCTGK